jgi:predicted N-formylglutamate amidohydrolase
MVSSGMSDRISGQTMGHGTLLGKDDPPAVTVTNPQGRSPFLLVGDHAGNAIPKALGTLGISEEDRARHIGWDIGTAALGDLLAAALDAVLVRQTYSRLVIDCNRDPGASDAIPKVSDGSMIPGNEGLDDVERTARVREIHGAYQQAIAAEIARRSAAGMTTVLVSLHSFTPVFGGTARPWHIGILHDSANDGFALGLLRWLREQDDLVVGDNEPYTMDGTDHTVPCHAFPSLAYVEIEVSQAGLSDARGIAAWASRLDRGLRAAL